MTETRFQQYGFAFLLVCMGIFSADCAAADPSKRPKRFSDSLRMLERSVNKRDVSMEELGPQLGDLLQLATTDAERAAVHRRWGDAFRVRKQYSEAVASYDRCQELAPENSDPKRSPVPYYKDLSKVESIYGKMGRLGLVVLAVSIICGCLFLRVQPVNRKAILCLPILVLGWVILSYGVTLAVDARKVAGYPVGNQETGGNYVFVLLGFATNPYFWRFVLWGIPMLVFCWLMAINHKANRFANYGIVPVLLVQSVALMALLQIGFSWFPSLYGPERIPYFSSLVLARGQVAWARPLALSLAVALAIGCIVATVIALKRTRPWLHRPCQFMTILTAAVALVAIFNHVNREEMVHLTAEACYYNAPEIEDYVRKHPDSFVNLHAEEAESDELKRFIQDNTPSVPPDDFRRERRDDAK